MALYRFAEFIKQTELPAFSTVHSPGTIAPYAGIYRCGVCAAEIVSDRGQPLPMEGEPKHRGFHNVPMKWRLVVKVAHAEKKTDKPLGKLGKKLAK